MNGSDLIEYQEKHPELQEQFLKKIGAENLPEMIQTKKLESKEYWEFVQGEMN